MYIKLSNHHTSLLSISKKNIRANIIFFCHPHFSKKQKQKKMSLEEKNQFFDCRLDITCNNDEFLQFLGHRKKLSELVYFAKLFELSTDNIVIEKPNFHLVFKITVPFPNNTIKCFLTTVYDSEFEHNEDPMDIMMVGLYFGIEGDLISVLEKVITKYLPTREDLKSKHYQDNLLKFLLAIHQSAVPLNIVKSLLSRFYGCLQDPDPLLTVIKDVPKMYFNPHLSGYHNGKLYLPQGCGEVEYDDLIFQVSNTFAYIDTNESHGFWVTCKRKNDPIKLESLINRTEDHTKEAVVELIVFDCFNRMWSENIYKDYKKKSVVFPTPWDYSFRGYQRGRYGTTSEDTLFHFAYCFEITFL
jgi:hypothetical protein